MRSVPPRGSGWVLVWETLNLYKVEQPTRYRVVVLTSFPENTYEQSRKHQRQEEEKKEEDCPRDLQEPEGVLDYPNSILAVGQRGRRYQDRR